MADRVPPGELSNQNADRVSRALAWIETLTNRQLTTAPLETVWANGFPLITAPQSARPNWIAGVRNSTGAARVRGEIVRIDGDAALTPPDTDPYLVQVKPHFDGTVPADPTDTIAVYVKDSIPEDESAPAIVGGIAVVTVNVSNITHQFAEPYAGGGVTKLRSAECGPAKILDKESSGLGDQECTVLLNQSCSAAPAPSAADCSADGLAWILGKDALTYEDATAVPPIKARMFALALRNGTGLCACLADQGDSGLGRFLADPTDATAFDPQAGDTLARAKWDVDGDGKWAGLFNFEGCCGGCFTLKIDLDLTKPTLPGMVIGTATVTGTKCDAGASSTFILYAGCGERPGVAKLHAFSRAVCDWPPTDPECDNAFDLWIKCLPCDVPNVGCDSCREKVGPAIWKVAVGGVTSYLTQDEPCGCVWSDACSGATLTVGATTITVTHASNTYVFDTNTATPGEDFPPSCWYTPVTLPWTSGPAGSGSAVITPLACLPITPTSVDCPLYDAIIEIDEFMMPVPIPTIYIRLVSMTGTTCPACSFPGSPISMSYVSDAGGVYTYSTGSITICGQAASSITAQIDTTLSGCSMTLAAVINGVYAGVATVINYNPLCASGYLTLGGDPEEVDCTILWHLSSDPDVPACPTTRWYCIDTAGVFSCEELSEEPVSFVSAHDTQADCAAACACAGGAGFMALMMAPGGGEGEMVMGLMAAPKVTASRGAKRYVPLPTVPCKFLGEMLTKCTSCQGNKAERHTFACDHPDNGDGRCTRGDTRSDHAPWTCGACERYEAT